MPASIHPRPDGTVLIQTGRLLLRAAQPTDAEGLHVCFSDPEVMRYWSTLPHPSLSETQSWLSKMISSTATNGVTDFVIVLLPSSDPSADQSATPNTPPPLSPIPYSAVIGKIGIFAPLAPSSPSPTNPSSPPGKISGEIGFLLCRAYQRRGLVSEALSAVLDYLFERIGVSSISADVDPRNEASRGILAKHGFVVTGRAERTWEVGGVWVDSEFWGLIREEWVGRRREEKNGATGVSARDEGA